MASVVLTCFNQTGSYKRILFFLFFPLVFPNNFYQFGLVPKAGAFAVALPGNTARGCTQVVTVFVQHLVVLIAAIAAEQEYPAAFIPVFRYRSRRVPKRLLFDVVNTLLHTGRNTGFCRFVALRLQNQHKKDSRKKGLIHRTGCCLVIFAKQKQSFGEKQFC